MLMNKNGENWRVSFDDEGRDGYVHYKEGGKTLSFYWAIGGGDVAASISVGDEAEWRAQYPDVAARRDEIIARIAAEAIRLRSPSSRAEIDATGRFLNFVSGAGAASASAPLHAPLTAGATPAQRRAEGAAMVWRLNKVKRGMSVFILILTFIAGGVMLAGRSTLTVRTMGTPVGASARAGEFIATPIGRLEPYVPSLNRDHGRDRYSIGLLIHSAADRNVRRYVMVAAGKTGSDSVNVRISGVVGERVFFNAPESVVVDARAARALSPAEAAMADEPPRPKGAEALALLATSDRRLESLLAAPGDDGAPMSIDAGAEIFNAAFLRAAPNGALLTLDGGDFLAVYWTRPYRAGPLFAARVRPSGAVAWRTETALGSLGEALPDPARPALVGERPQAEGKVPEPLLIILDAGKGGADAHSLLID